MSTDADRSARLPWGLSLGGLVLVLIGTAGYFVVVTQLPGRLPSMRNHAVPNWLLIGLGIALGAVAVRRAPGRWVPRLLLGVNAMLAGLFAAMLYGALRVPPAVGPLVGKPAPDFAQLDQTGQQVRLADLRGAPLLVVFYRGHW